MIGDAGVGDGELTHSSESTVAGGLPGESFSDLGGPCRDSAGRAPPRRPAGPPGRCPGAAAWSGVRPTPRITTGSASRRSSTSSRHAFGSPTGVMPPYSMPDSSTARSIDRNVALRTSSRRRTQVVDVGAGVGADDAGGDALLAGRGGRSPPRSCRTRRAAGRTPRSSPRCRRAPDRSRPPPPGRPAATTPGGRRRAEPRGRGGRARAGTRVSGSSAASRDHHVPFTSTSSSRRARRPRPWPHMTVTWQVPVRDRTAEPGRDPGDRGSPRRQRAPARAHARRLPYGDPDGRRRHRDRPGLDPGRRARRPARVRAERHDRRHRPPRVRDRVTTPGASTARGHRLVHRGLHPRRAQDPHGARADARDCGPPTRRTTGARASPTPHRDPGHGARRVACDAAAAWA